MEGAPPKPQKSNTATDLLVLTTPMPPFVVRQTTHNTKTGVWVSIQTTLLNVISLSTDKWRDTIQRRYGLELVDLPKCCDSFGTKFIIEHALACKKGGLVVGHHNELKAETERGHSDTSNQKQHSL